MSDTYKVAVVGMGKRGKHHAAAFHANPRFQVAGVCDIDKARAEEAAADLDSPVVETDSQKLVDQVKPDVYCFCTLPTIRMPLIEQAVQSGAKLIAFEKPISMLTDEGIAINKLLCESGVKAVVSHQHRYGVHYQKVKEIIASGALGRVHTVYGVANGWMTHLMSHLVDYMRWYNDNAEAEWVMAQAAGTGKFADVHASPDYIGGFIHFANGVRGVVECGAGAPDVPEVDYWWRKCRIGAQGTDGFAEVLTGGGWRAVTKDGASSGEGCMNYDLDMPPYIQEMADWLDDDTKVHSCNFDSAFKGFEIVMALCRSAAKGGQIALPLTGGQDDLAALKDAIGSQPVLTSSEENTAEYLG